MKHISLLITILSFSYLGAQNTNFEKVSSFFYKTTRVVESKKELFNKFGKPDSIKVDAVINKYDTTSTDTLFHYFYNGFDVSYYSVKKTKACYLFKFILYTNRISLPMGIKLGMNREEVQAVFGEPVEEEKYQLWYHDNGELVSEIYFIFEDNFLKEIILLPPFE